MKKNQWLICVLFLSLPAWSRAGINEAITHYNPQGNSSVSAERGDALWHKKNTGADGKERDCTVCHGDDLKKSGKHIKTGKVIDPMAPSVNKERYTDLEKIEKWFTRNCKWTFGRECTNQEKADLLKYLSQF